MVLIDKFTEKEAADAYDLYVCRGNDDHAAEQKKAFGICLKTPYGKLPGAVKQLIRNPVFLQYLARTYHQVNASLTEEQVLLDFYKETLSEEWTKRHRYFLAYFLEVLWHKKSDHLTEDDLHEKHKTADSPEFARAIDKLQEYYHEPTVGGVRKRFVCENTYKGTDRNCRIRDLELRPDEVGGDVCAECGGALTVKNTPLHSTYFFLQDEGIVSCYQPRKGGDGIPILRFTYDHFFAIMMARHLMHVLAREKAGQSVAPQVATWISDVVEIPIYHDVMVHLLIMLYDQRSETDPTDPMGYSMIYMRIRRMRR